MVGKMMRPPPWRRAWPPILALLFWSLTVAIVTVWWVNRPLPSPTEPLRIISDRTSEPRAGIWRLETVAEINVKCRVVTVDRLFAVQGEAMQRMAPVAASVPGLAGAVADRPYVLSITPGRVELWLEYVKVPGLSGDYIIQIEAYGCENDWRGPLPARVLPFDWRRS
jgi:hypothetical protein